MFSVSQAMVRRSDCRYDQFGPHLLELAAGAAQISDYVLLNLPEESMAMDVWLLRRRESDLRKLTRQVRRYLEKELTASKAWFASGETVAKQPRRKQ
jgi:hypothetical protein